MSDDISEPVKPPEVLHWFDRLLLMADGEVQPEFLPVGPGKRIPVIKGDP